MNIGQNINAERMCSVHHCFKKCISKKISFYVFLSNIIISNICILNIVYYYTFLCNYFSQITSLFYILSAKTIKKGQTLLSRGYPFKLNIFISTILYSPFQWPNQFLPL